MSARVIVGAGARELVNGLRVDARHRAVMLFAVAVNLALGWGAASRLVPAIARWQAAGDGAVERGLGGLSAALLLAAAGIGWITLGERAFGARARLLFVLPLTRAERVRALAGQCALQLAGGFGVTLGAVWLALLAALRGSALPWIALQLAGDGLALWLTLLLQMGWAGMGWKGGLRLLAWPGAGAAGALYERAFLRQEEGAARCRPRRFLRRLTRPLSAWRGPSGALLVREILARGRSRLEGFRAGIFAAALLLLFPWLRPLLAAHGLPGVLGVVAAVAGVMLFLVFDGAASPLGSEGSRLLHFLTAPMSVQALLRAKLAALLLPLGVAGAAGVWALASRSGLPLGDLAWAEGATALLLFGIAVVFTLGSAWDADLELEIESGLRGLVQETAPTTTVRMGLFLAASLLAAAQIGMLARLPPAAGLAALAASDGVLFALLGRPAARALASHP